MSNNQYSSNSGNGTPSPSNILTNGGFQFSALNDILQDKYKHIINNSNISKDTIDDQRSINNSIYFNSYINGSGESKSNSNTNLYQVNIKPSSINNLQNKNNCTRFIRGGGGKEPQQSGFLHNMLNNNLYNNNSNEKNVVKSPFKYDKKKLNHEQILNNRLKEELGNLSSEETDQHQETEFSFKEITQVKKQISQKKEKDKNGLFNFFSKMISK